MSSQRINVLVYSGNGSTVESVRHCLYTLRRLLSPNYAVIPVTGDMILKEPWTTNCAALVFPGGADTGYCRTLNGEGNRRIRQFVERGGLYIGFCAGGYYGTKRCEFEVGDKLMEVVGPRELGFFPGISRGCAFAGFVYNSEKGARAVKLSVNKQALSTGLTPNVFKSYYNGGSVFVDAPKYADKGVEILASYTEELSVDPGEGRAAVVYCKVGNGAALLTGPHPEFSGHNLQEKPEIPGFSDVIKQLKDDEHHRMDFLKACMTKLGLTVSDEQNVPSLSRIFVSSLIPSHTSKVLSNLEYLIKKDEDGEEMLRDENDTFHIVRPSVWSMVDLTKALPTEGLTVEGKEAVADKSNAPSDRILDYNSIIKQLLFHDSDVPDTQATPYFDHAVFYANLKHYQAKAGLRYPTFGTHLLYGEVVTSTNTLLEKNIHLLSTLPHGFTATATTQVAGRGRGSNVWVSPPGNLIFSTTIRHPMSMMQTAPIVFLQYLAAMAVVRGIKNYTGACSSRDTFEIGDNPIKLPYQNMPIKLKWPNDIYALDPTKIKIAQSDTTNNNKPKRREDYDIPENYVKIGGILVNSHYNSKDYIAVCGIGLNVSNTATPTTSLNQLVPFLPFLSSSSSSSSSISPGGEEEKEKELAPEKFTLEPLLSSILASFEQIYLQFTTSTSTSTSGSGPGFSEDLEKEYYSMWLHTDQTVVLETDPSKPKAMIKGITRDFGLLVAEELIPRVSHGGTRGGREKEKEIEWKSTGRKWELMSDSNSFDFLNGLVRRKK